MTSQDLLLVRKIQKSIDSFMLDARFIELSESQRQRVLDVDTVLQNIPSFGHRRSRRDYGYLIFRLFHQAVQGCRSDAKFYPDIKFLSILETKDKERHHVAHKNPIAVEIFVTKLLIQLMQLGYKSYTTLEERPYFDSLISAIIKFTEHEKFISLELKDQNRVFNILHRIGTIDPFSNPRKIRLQYRYVLWELDALIKKGLPKYVLGSTFYIYTNIPLPDILEPDDNPLSLGTPEVYTYISRMVESLSDFYLQLRLVTNPS